MQKGVGVPLPTPPVRGSATQVRGGFALPGSARVFTGAELNFYPLWDITQIRSSTSYVTNPVFTYDPVLCIKTGVSYSVGVWPSATQARSNAIAPSRLSRLFGGTYQYNGSLTLTLTDLPPGQYNCRYLVDVTAQLPPGGNGPKGTEPGDDTIIRVPLTSNNLPLPAQDVFIDTNDDVSATSWWHQQLFNVIVNVGFSGSVQLVKLTPDILVAPQPPALLIPRVTIDVQLLGVQAVFGKGVGVGGVGQGAVDLPPPAPGNGVGLQFGSPRWAPRPIGQQ